MVKGPSIKGSYVKVAPTVFPVTRVAFGSGRNPAVIALLPLQSRGDLLMTVQAIISGYPTKNVMASRALVIVIKFGVGTG